MSFRQSMNSREAKLGVRGPSLDDVAAVKLNDTRGALPWDTPA
jgi:hypothetical protein